jgi:hypothetical protein
VLRKARSKWMKRLDAFINPKASARPRPQQVNAQLSLLQHEHLNT